MNNKKWDLRFLKLAECVSEWSKDPSTKCGAVIVDPKNRVISLGYNGYPRKIEDSDMHIRDLKYEKVLHSETNAILFANRSIEGCPIYVYPMPPCARCMAMIIQSGINRIITKKPTRDQSVRWAESFKISFAMADEVNLKINFLK